MTELPLIGEATAVATEPPRDVVAGIYARDDGVHVTEFGVGVPEFDGGAAGEADGAGGVAVIKGAGERDDADPGAGEPAGHCSVAGGVSDQGEFSHVRPRRPRR